jgi:hypothetical protein
MFDLILYFKEEYKKKLGKDYWREVYSISLDFSNIGVGLGGDFTVMFSKDSEKEEIIKEIKSLDYILSYEIKP